MAWSILPYDGCLSCCCAEVPEVPPTPVEYEQHCICLVFDMRNIPPVATSDGDALGQWYTWGSEASPLPGIPAAMIVHNGGPEPTALRGRMYYLDDTGVVRYETEDQWFDDTDTPILTRVKFAPLSLGQLGGAERIYRGQADGEFRGLCTIRMTNEIADERRGDPVIETDDIVMADDTNEEFELNTDPGRATSQILTLEEVASGQLTEGWALKAIGLEVGVKGRMRKLGKDQQTGSE